MITRVASALQGAQKILIITHESPDGDAAGSSLGLAHALWQLGKDVTVTCVDEIPEPFRFLPGSDKFVQDSMLGNYDVVFFNYFGDLKRTGMPERIRAFARSRHTIINIDHHQRNDLHKLATLNYVNDQSSSAAELVFPLVQALGVSFNKQIATCLLTGLYNDTGGFKHSNTTPDVLQQAAELMRSGARLKHIRTHVANYKSVSALKLWGLALSRLRQHERLGIVISAITQADFVACNALAEDLAGCVNLINAVPNAKAAILLAEMPDGRIKASVRTEHGSVDVGAVAQLFGGGGIRKAAGFSFQGRIIAVGDTWQIVSTHPFALRLPFASRSLAPARASS